MLKSPWNLTPYGKGRSGAKNISPPKNQIEQKYSKRTNQGRVLPLREPLKPADVRQGDPSRVPENTLPTQINKKEK